MYERLLNLWVTNRLTQAQLDAAVGKNWITAEQAEAIAATPRNT